MVVAEEAVAPTAREAGDRADEALALGILGSDLALLGRVDEGIERFNAGMAIAEDLDSTEGVALGATEPGDPARSRRPDERRAGRGGGRLAASPRPRRRADLRRPPPGRRREGGHRAWPMGRGGRVPRHRAGAPDRSDAGVKLRIQRGRLDTWRGALADGVIAAGGRPRRPTTAAGGTDDRAGAPGGWRSWRPSRRTPPRLGPRSTRASGWPPSAPADPGLAQLAATGLRVEADAAASARAHRDAAALETARQRAEAVMTAVERTAAALGVPAEASHTVAPSRIVALGLTCRAEARRVDERDDAAGWAAVAAAWAAIGRPYPAAYARYREAAARLRDRGDRAEARAALALPARPRWSLGAGPLLDDIDRLARQGRIQVGSDGRPDPASDPGASTSDAPALTDRELEVLRLIAGGWSNQEIADALFISRKTASVHASHIYDKLGTGNRAEAAAVARRLGLVEDAPPPPGSRTID